MRFVRYVILAAFMVAIIVLAVANKDIVSLHLMPPGLATIYQAELQLPLFIVLLATLVVGVMLGYLLEWGREMRQRREASETRREIARLRAELDRLTSKTGEKKDDVLALLG